MNSPFEVQTSGDGRTVWVNAADGSCIGRFSKRFGLDVHNTASAQFAGADQCLFCTHEPPGQEGWTLFREKMKSLHGVEVPDDAIEW